MICVIYSLSGKANFNQLLVLMRLVSMDSCVFYVFQVLNVNYFFIVLYISKLFTYGNKSNFGLYFIFPSLRFVEYYMINPLLRDTFCIIALYSVYKYSNIVIIFL